MCSPAPRNILAAGAIPVPPIDELQSDLRKLILIDRPQQEQIGRASEGDTSGRVVIIDN